MGEKTTTVSSSGGAGLRVLVLLGILVVLCGAVAYDYLYAQPLAYKVHDEIFNYCDDSMAKSGGSDNKPKLFTPADIHKMLGEKFNGGKDYLPTKVTAVKPGHIVETYAIMGGAVLKTHDVHVIYSANDPETAKEGRSEAKFSTVVLGKFPSADLLPQGKEADTSVAIPPPPTPGGAGGGGPPGGGGRRPGGESATTSEEKKEGEKKEEEKKEEGKKEEGKPETPPAEPKPEGEKKEETKPEAPPAESKPEGEKKEETKPEPPKDAAAKPEEKPAEPKG